jgi:L-rhamnose isomerase/sugar isomerase
MSSTPIPFKILLDGSASFKYGSLTNSSQEARDKAIEVNTQSIDNGKILGSKGLTVWVGDGGNFPGQMSFSKVIRKIYRLDEKDLCSSS